MSDTPASPSSRPGSAAGDAGYTDLLGRRRVPKEHASVEALGQLDEATSLVGLARCAAQQDGTRRLLLQMQADLYELMAELAFPPEHAKAIRITAEHVAWLDRVVMARRAALPELRHFVLPGACEASARLDVARTAVRTAERRLAVLVHDDTLTTRHALAYVNRLSLALFYLARSEDHAAGIDFALAGTPTTRPEP